jgi:hypothetical protein
MAFLSDAISLTNSVAVAGAVTRLAIELLADT